MKDKISLDDSVSVELGIDSREPFISSEDALILEDVSTPNPEVEVKNIKQKEERKYGDY